MYHVAYASHRTSSIASHFPGRLLRIYAGSSAAPSAVRLVSVRYRGGRNSGACHIHCREFDILKRRGTGSLEECTLRFCSSIVELRKCVGALVAQQTVGTTVQLSPAAIRSWSLLPRANASCRQVSCRYRVRDSAERSGFGAAVWLRDARVEFLATIF